MYRYPGLYNTAGAMPMLDAAKLAYLDEFIEANIARPIGLADLAGVAGLSEYYFCRCFKQATGTSPYQYLLGKRIERACACLMRADLSIQDVAFASGFGDPVQFSKRFRRTQGATPSEFRALHLSGRAAFVNVV